MTLGHITQCSDQVSMDAERLAGLQYMWRLKLLIQRGEKCICYEKPEHAKANAERRHNPSLFRYRTRI